MLGTATLRTHSSGTQWVRTAKLIPIGRLEPAVTNFGTATGLLQKKLAQDLLRFLTNFLSLFFLVILEIIIYTQ